MTWYACMASWTARGLYDDLRATAWMAPHWMVCVIALLGGLAWPALLLVQLVYWLRHRG